MGDQVLGLICCAIAAVGFGSNYLPVKQVDCGDGFFFAAMMSIGIAMVGLAVNESPLSDEGRWHDSPRFEPWAMVGGAAWMLGNLMTPKIIQYIGLGLGLTVWDMSNMLMGWATGNFGLFGVWREEVKHQWMNYTGVALACVSLTLLAQANDSDYEAKEAGACASEAEGAKKDLEAAVAAADLESQALPATCQPNDDTTAEDLSDQAEENHEASAPSSSSPQSTIKEQCATTGVGSDSGDVEMGTGDASNEAASFSGSGGGRGCPPAQQVAGKDTDLSRSGSPLLMRARSLTSSVGVEEARWAGGFCMALLAGCLFGYTFDTATTLMQDGRSIGTHSTNPMDYVLSHFCGILAMGLLALVVYCCWMGERRYTPRKLVLPSIASGLMWGVAQAAWFQANQELSIVVAFPIISSLPGMVALAWGVMFFGELRSARSRRFVAAGLCLRVPSVCLIALSNC